MAPLPLFKLAALFVRHISKHGANRIKEAAHDHPRFRAFAARHGQSIHQLSLRLSVAQLRNFEAEMRAKDLAEAPTVKTREQIEKEEKAAEKKGTAAAADPAATAGAKVKKSVWNRKFRPLPEAKAVALFAAVVGDAFILGIASALLLFEYWRASRKPDANLERIQELNETIEEMKRVEEDLEARGEKQRKRLDELEAALRALTDPKSKKPLLPSLQVDKAADAAPSTT